MINRANALSGDRGYLNGDNAIPADAFIFPDDPLVLDKFRAALIHPDDPLTPREEEGGIVVGMDGSTKLEALGPGTVLLDPNQVADLLEAVSWDLRKNGWPSLRHWARARYFSTPTKSRTSSKLYPGISEKMDSTAFDATEGRPASKPT